MLNQILFALWFFLPAGIANMIPIPIAKIPFLKKHSYPLDNKKTLNGKRILGDHKTIRGLIAGIIAGILVTYLQQQMYSQSEWIQSFSQIDYTVINPLVLGLLSALGALGGDALKSFFKRQINYPPGKTWIPFDQLDYVVGGILATALYIHLSFTTYIYIVIIWLLIHPLSTLVGYLLKLKDSPI